MHEAGTTGIGGRTSQYAPVPELVELADEIRDRLCSCSGIRTAHFASNLG
ncbi:MAG: hypothetical protein U0892_05350 [Pirellulales bacterium]